MIKAFRKRIKTFRMLLRNFVASRRIPLIPAREENDVQYRALRPNDFGDFLRMLQDLNDGKGCSRDQVRLYRQLGGRTIMVAQRVSAPDSGIIGINLYYFNPRDVQEKTIHEGFIGVLPGYAGRGIATLMRTLAQEHFRKAGISGVSSRITKSNTASLASAEKAGFQIHEAYTDQKSGEQRYYLIRKFREAHS